jgi:hypothetical protein
VEYLLFIHRGDETTGRAAPQDFGHRLAKGETVLYGGVDCIVDDVREDDNAPTVWLRPI